MYKTLFQIANSYTYYTVIVVWNQLRGCLEILFYSNTYIIILWMAKSLYVTSNKQFVFRSGHHDFTFEKITIIHRLKSIAEWIAWTFNLYRGKIILWYCVSHLRQQPRISEYEVT